MTQAPEVKDVIMEGIKSVDEALHSKPETAEVHDAQAEFHTAPERVTEIDEVSTIKIGDHGIDITPFMHEGVKLYKLSIHHEPGVELLPHIPFYTQDLEVATAMVAAIVDEYQYTLDKEAGNNTEFLAMYFNQHIIRAYKAQMFHLPTRQTIGPYEIKELLDIPNGGGKVFIFDYNSVTFIFSFCLNPWMKDVGSIICFVSDIFVARKNFSTARLTECAIELADRVNGLFAHTPEFEADEYSHMSPEQQAQERFKHRLTMQAIIIQTAATAFETFNEDAFIKAIFAGELEHRMKQEAQAPAPTDEGFKPKPKMLDAAMSHIVPKTPTI